MHCTQNIHTHSNGLFSRYTPQHFTKISNPWCRRAANSNSAPYAEHAEPWAGQVHVLSATQASMPAIPSGESGLRNAKTAHAETANFGFKWLSEQVKH